MSSTPRRLVIVESPAKAKTIAGYLGRDYVVESSIGHVRDLPRKATEIPAAYKDRPWARLGVDVEHDFAPLYIVTPDKKSQVTKLRSALKEADELLLATDEDREGEAIAWHLREVLKPRVPVRRMVFHEITRDAIRRAVEQPREIDQRLVDAQETRRILDRLYGYEVSPVLWKKVMPKLSAGRVQSVATRLLVERERARMAFREAEYWDLEATFVPGGFAATLVALDGRRVATGRDFGPDGRLRPADVAHLDEPSARALAARLAGAGFTVRRVEHKPYRRSPYAPFRTTTLQQEASRKFGWSASRTMSVAQRLYENGFITYMRTDSTALSETAVGAARAQARELYGATSVPDAPRSYQNKVKNAQEAHEAIRPSGEQFRVPGETGLGGDEFRLYELIWRRTLASQMADALGQSVSVRIAATSSGGEDVEFAATGKVITSPGFLQAYVESVDDPDTVADDREQRLPQVAEGDRLTAERLEARGHVTKPPARYTEATLVKELEEREIGRPSTYASIMSTILDRGYAFKKGSALVPSWLAFAVVQLLERHFGRLVDYRFTAAMEDDLDEIARGEQAGVPWLRRFYFGDGSAGLHRLVTDLGEIDARGVNSFPIADDVVLRVGRYGPYLERGEERANVPDDLPPDELTADKARELLATPSGDRVLGRDPTTGREIVARVGRYGPYVTETLPEEAAASAKPRTASLLRSMALDTVTLDDALRLLALPRVLGTDPTSGEEVTAQIGRYGPYVKRGSESRSLEHEEQVFTVTLDDALARLAEPKGRGGRGGARPASAPPLRELGPDPATGRAMVVKEGRFGPYVTDGETNASLRRDDGVEELTAQRAAELLAERRARSPARPARRTRRSPAPRS